MNSSGKATAARGRKASAKSVPAQAPARPDATLQRRGVERVQAILDAAEAILGEDGYEAATLKAVGERAGIPTASVYHYFADRHQVDTQLLLRHINNVNVAVRDSLSRLDSAPTARAIVDAVIDPTVSYFRTHPSAVELWFRRTAADADANAVQTYDDETAAYVHSLAVSLGILRESTPVLVMQTAFEVGNSLFDVAFRRSPRTGDDDTLDEARLMLSLYFEAYAPGTD
ncbi:TetR/AcrR family transcriptional regulator [Nocardia stercoris]|uniref:TetR/AcrR family transcriptional regulator n=1 Tax=Nocardia stercoris TaxID=2483361 RepID=A0A3M2L140_9NOCA|nr:TetR/AcrR family transcriptional regulator [Nocardia stercoris]